LKKERRKDRREKEKQGQRSSDSKKAAAAAANKDAPVVNTNAAHQNKQQDINLAYEALQNCQTTLR